TRRRTVWPEAPLRRSPRPCHDLLVWRRTGRGIGRCLWRPRYAFGPVPGPPHTARCSHRSSPGRPVPVRATVPTTAHGVTLPAPHPTSRLHTTCEGNSAGLSHALIHRLPAVSR